MFANETMSGSRIQSVALASAAPPPPIDYGRNVLIEGYDGGPPYELDFCVQHQERKFTHDGVHYEHVSNTASGQWVYRPMP